MRAFRRSRTSSWARSVNESTPALGSDVKVALAVAGALAAHYNDGYVLLIVPPYRTEISLNLAMLALFSGFVIFYAVLRGLALTLSLPQRVRDFRERRLRDKTAVEITEITRLIYEGRFGLALKKAVAVHASAQSSALAAMLAARSAQRLHEPLKQKEWLDIAVQDDSKMQPACWMMEAEMLVEMQRFDEASSSCSACTMPRQAGMSLPCNSNCAPVRGLGMRMRYSASRICSARCPVA